MSSRGQVALIAVVAVALIAVVAGAALLLTRSGSSSGLKASVVAPAAVQRFPKPPPGAFVVARQDRSDALALAVVLRHEGVVLQVSDITQDGVGARGLKVAFDVRSKTGTASKQAVGCGAGCYRAALVLTSPPQQVRVRVVREARTTRWNVVLPVPFPAKDASAIVARATRTWKQLQSLSYRERLASDPKHFVLSDWQIVAPDRLAYQIQGEGQAVIVGVRRWDRPKGGDWVETSALRLHQPEPFWVEATNAYVVGSATVQGHAVWRVSFFDPRTPGWFLAAIDKKTDRTLDVQMTAAAHFMHDSYGGFNTSIKIDPPSTS
jgi:hypothetical protein